MLCPSCKAGKAKSFFRRNKNRYRTSIGRVGKNNYYDTPAESIIFIFYELLKYFSKTYRENGKVPVMFLKNITGTPLKRPDVFKEHYKKRKHTLIQILNPNKNRRLNVLPVPITD